MTWLVATLMAFLAAVLTQYLLLRFTGLRSAVVAFAIAGMGIGLGLTAYLLLFHELDYVVAGSLLYAFMSEMWIFVFTFVLGSVSANLMRHLGKRGMTRDEIDMLYDSRLMIRGRISGLHNSAAITSADGHLLPTTRGRWLAQLFNAVRTFFGHS